MFGSFLSSTLIIAMVTAISRPCSICSEMSCTLRTFHCSGERIFCLKTKSSMNNSLWQFFMTMEYWYIPIAMLKNFTYTTICLIESFDTYNSWKFSTNRLMIRPFLLYNSCIYRIFDITLQLFYIKLLSTLKSYNNCFLEIPSFRYSRFIPSKIHLCNNFLIRKNSFCTHIKHDFDIFAFNRIMRIYYF